MVAASNYKGKGKAVDDLVAGSSSGMSNNDDDDSDFEEVTQEYLDSLIAQAKQNVARKRLERASVAVGEDEEIRLPEENGAQKLPELDPGRLPPTYITLGKDRRDFPSAVRDVDVEYAEQASSSSSGPAPPLPPKPVNKDGKPLTAKEKKLMKNKTAGPGWFDLPSPDAADLPRLYREVEALRLRNALDPKRFYKREEGEGKGIKGLPKHFAIGTIIPSTTPFGTASHDNLTRAERKRTIVDELVDDAEAKRYAKRKFEDLQGVRGAKGRGTLAKKKALRKPKW
ncbi:Fcf2-domain-containing protein [Rickenella mellea]|uniref:Fcf2-domain-containing protein n=1 Tax=Rickenella mellea TaxID=50990 RepID=A0A4Y7Q657_9AGAM|nr:Fcf2-domain-containing protein [Rickenella mellea]